MKFLFAVFFMFAISADIAVSLVKQIQGRDMYEIADMDADDAEDGKTAEKEKETYTICLHPVIEFIKQLPESTKKSVIYTEDNLISEYHVMMPELPPEV